MSASSRAAVLASFLMVGLLLSAPEAARLGPPEPFCRGRGADTALVRRKFLHPSPLGIHEPDSVPPSLTSTELLFAMFSPRCAQQTVLVGTNPALGRTDRGLRNGMAAKPAGGPPESSPPHPWTSTLGGARPYRGLSENVHRLDGPSLQKLPATGLIPQFRQSVRAFCTDICTVHLVQYRTTWLCGTREGM